MHIRGFGSGKEKLFCKSISIPGSAVVSTKAIKDKNCTAPLLLYCSRALSQDGYSILDLSLRLLPPRGLPCQNTTEDSTSRSRLGTFAQNTSSPMRNRCPFVRSLSSRDSVLPSDNRAAMLVANTTVLSRPSRPTLEGNLLSRRL